MISIGGNRSSIPRAMTDLAVPRRPAIATPPSWGSTVASKRASLINSCPTTAVKGKLRLTGLVVTTDIKEDIGKKA